MYFSNKIKRMKYPLVWLLSIIYSLFTRNFSNWFSWKNITFPAPPNHICQIQYTNNNKWVWFVSQTLNGHGYKSYTHAKFNAWKNIFGIIDKF